MRPFVLIIILSLIFAACKADFDPNAEWREVPLLYCVLDIDDSVSYVRVQKCFLGDRNLLSYASIADSSTYPAGSISVDILVWNSADDIERADVAPIDTMHFNYTMLDNKSQGTFFAPNQPIYKHVNVAGELRDDRTYQLIVRRQPSGTLLAQATTTLVGSAQRMPWLVNPHPTTPGRSFHFRRSDNCDIDFYSFPQGRRYEPTIRFFYRCRFQQPDSIRYVDIPCNAVVSSLNEETLHSTISLSTFLAGVQHALRSDTSAKTYIDTVEVRLAVCNEPMHAYLNAIDMVNSSAEQDHQVFTNVVGGIGVFGSRRTHLVLRVPADNSDVPPRGLHVQLDSLYVGFDKE